MDFFGIRQCEVCVSLFYVDRNFVEGTIKRRQQKKPKECSHLYYAEDDAEDDGFFASTGQRSCQTVRLFLIGGRVFGFFLGSPLVVVKAVAVSDQPISERNTKST